MPCMPELPLNGSLRKSKLISSIQCKPRHTCLAYPSCPRVSAARKHKVCIFHVLCTHTTSLLRICVVCYTQDRKAKQQAKVLQVWQKHAMQKTRYSAGYICIVCLCAPKRIPCLQELLNTIATMSARSAELQSDASGPPLMPPELLRLPMLHKSWR